MASEWYLKLSLGESREWEDRLSMAAHTRNSVKWQCYQGWKKDGKSGKGEEKKHPVLNYILENVNWACNKAHARHAQALGSIPYTKSKGTNSLPSKENKFCYFCLFSQVVYNQWFKKQSQMSDIGPLAIRLFTASRVSYPGLLFPGYTDIQDVYSITLFLRQDITAWFGLRSGRPEFFIDAVILCINILKSH